MSRQTYFNGVVLLASVSMLAGCGSVPVEYEAIDRVGVDGFETSFQDALLSRMTGDSSRVEVDVPRAVERCYWGLLSFERVTDDDAMAVYRAKAILADDRTADIIVWSANESRVHAAIRVGHFGDVHQQKRFCQMLAKTLRDKPRPKRGGGFKLP